MPRAGGASACPSTPARVVQRGSSRSVLLDRVGHDAVLVGGERDRRPGRRAGGSTSSSRPEWRPSRGRRTRGPPDGARSGPSKRLPVACARRVAGVSSRRLWPSFAQARQVERGDLPAMVGSFTRILVGVSESAMVCRRGRAGRAAYRAGLADRAGRVPEPLHGAAQILLGPGLQGARPQLADALRPQEGCPARISWLWSRLASRIWSIRRRLLEPPREVGEQVIGPSAQRRGSRTGSTRPRSDE